MNNIDHIEDLNQIRERQQAVIDEIDEIKARRPDGESDDLDQLRAESLKLLSEIDEIKKRCDDNDQAALPAGKSGTASSD